MINYSQIQEKLMFFQFMDFIDACEHGYLDEVVSLLEHGADIHANNDLALRSSAQNGHLPVVQFLLEQGADIHADNDLALRWSACYGHLSVVQFLLEQGADIHAKNDCALRWSAENRHLAIVQYLLEHGAKIGDMSRYLPDIIAFIAGFMKKVRKIQHWWLEISMNPYHPVGIKLINQRYDKLFPHSRKI